MKISDRQIEKWILVILVLIALQSCNVENRIRAGGRRIVDRMLFVPMASAGALKEISAKIYALDSLTENTPIKMQSFDLKFYNGRESLLLHFDRIITRFHGDTLKVDDLKFPGWDVRKSTTKMYCDVSVSFSTPGRPAERCMLASYRVDEGKLNALDAPQLCP